MAPVSSAQFDAIRERISTLSAGSLWVAHVDVAEDDGVDGPAVLVTVVLGSGSDETWDPDDFLAIRRLARSAAVEELGGQTVRLVYAPGSPPEPDSDLVDEGGKPTDRSI